MGKGRECLFLLTSQMLDPSRFLSSCQVFPASCHSEQLLCLVSWRFFLEELTTPARPVVHFTRKYLGVRTLNRSFFSTSSAAEATFLFFPLPTATWGVLEGSSVAVCAKGVDGC